MWNITVGQGVEAKVIDPGGCADQSITGTTQVRTGRRIKVKYTGTEEFKSWSAPGTLLDGSAKKDTEFVLVVPGLTVSAMTWGTVTVDVPTATGATIEVEPLDPSITSGGGSLTGPPNASVSLSYTVTDDNSAAFGWKFENYPYFPDQTPSTSVTCRLSRVQYAAPLLLANYLYPTNYKLYTHRALMSGPGFAFAGRNGMAGSYTYMLAGQASFTVWAQKEPPATSLDGTYGFIAAPGWQISHVEHNAGIEYLDFADRITCTAPDLAMEACAKVVPQPSLDWKMESIDDSSASQESLGYCVADPASAYYKAATPYNQAAFEGTDELVAVTASTFTGSSLRRWKGTGRVYTSDGTVRTDVRLDAGDDEPELWVTDTTIYIKMAENNSPYTPRDKEVTAEVECDCADRRVYGEWKPQIFTGCGSNCDSVCTSDPVLDKCEQRQPGSGTTLVRKCVMEGDDLLYEWFFNTTRVGVCVFPCGVNEFQYRLNHGECRIVRTRHRTREKYEDENPICNEFHPEQINWQITQYDSATGSLTGLCRKIDWEDVENLQDVEDEMDDWESGGDDGPCYF